MANNTILGAMLLLIKAKADVTGFNKTDRAIGKTTKSIKNMSGSMARASRSIGLISKLSNLAFGYFSFRGVQNMFGGLVNFEKDLGAIHSRFYAITNDERQANEEFEYVRKIAKDTATNIKDVADSYSIFYASARNSLGKEGSREIFDNWTKIARVLHISGDQFERIMYAQREMSSKGQLYSQDLLVQMGTHVPDIRNIATEAIKRLNIKGVTDIKSFQEHTKKSSNSSEVMAQFMIEMSRIAKDRFASDEAVKKALQQPDALIGAIQNLGTDFMIEFSKKGGNYMIIQILTGIKNALLSIDYNALSSFLGNVSKAVGFVAHYLPQIFTVLTMILKSVSIFYGLKALKGVIGLLKGVKVFFGAMKILRGFGRILPRILYALEIAFPKLIGTFLHSGLKVALGGILGLSGPLGWLTTALMWLPEIFGFVKWIAKHLGYGEKTTALTSEFLNLVKQLRDSGEFKNTEQLRNALASKGYASELYSRISIDDHGQVTIYNTIDATVENLDKALDKVNQPPKKNTLNLAERLGINLKPTKQAMNWEGSV